MNGVWVDRHPERKSAPIETTKPTERTHQHSSIDDPIMMCRCHYRRLWASILYSASTLCRLPAASNHKSNLIEKPTDRSVGNLVQEAVYEEELAFWTELS